MRIRYKGPLDSVEIAATGQHVARGATIETDDDVAAALLAQFDTWVEVKATSKAKTTSKSKTASDKGDE